MAEPIAVMHLRASNFVGGPEKQILEHFAGLDRSRFRPVLATFVEPGERDPLGDEGRRRGFDTLQVPSASPLDPRAVFRLARLLKRQRIGILCTHGYKPNVLGVLACRLCGIPTIAVSRGWTWESAKIRLFEALDRRFLRWATHVVAVSAGQRDKILACGVPAANVSVIHNSIDLTACTQVAPAGLRQELGLPEDALVVASAGRLSPEKNYAAMIAVAAELAPTHAKLYFVIFGEGFLRPALEASIVAAGLQGRFLLPGFRTGLQQLLHEIDIFMLPSFTEGLPNVVLEAFAAKKPVVATRVGGTPEVVQDGISGFLTAPEESGLMAKKVLALAQDPALRSAMGEAGYRYAESHFGFAAQTRAYQELYSEVVR